MKCSSHVILFLFCRRLAELIELVDEICRVKSCCASSLLASWMLGADAVPVPGPGPRRQHLSLLSCLVLTCRPARGADLGHLTLPSSSVCSSRVWSSCVWCCVLLPGHRCPPPPLYLLFSPSPCSKTDNRPRPGGPALS